MPPLNYRVQEFLTNFRFVSSVSTRLCLQSDSKDCADTVLGATHLLSRIYTLY